MGNTKENRIKKLKKTRIWPSVLGLMLILTVFTIVIAVGMAFVVINTMTQKLNEGYHTSVKVANWYEANGKDEMQMADDKTQLFLDVMEEVEGIGVLDKNGEPVWSDAGVYPDMEKKITGNFTFDETADKIQIVIEDDGNIIYFDEDGNMDFHEDLFRQIAFKNIISDQQESVITLKIWFIIPLDTVDVCVLHRSAVYGYELISVIMIMSCFGILIAVFAIYYVLSLLGIVQRQRRVTKVMYTDMVTGGDNWLGFTKKTAKLIKHKGMNRKYAMVHVRMRRYRSFCTCFGVSKTEELIERIYGVLKKQLKSKELVAHYEKADFGLLLHYTDHLELTSRLQWIEQLLEKAFTNVKLKFCFGVCYIEDNGDKVEELYNNAVLAREMMGEDAEHQIAFFNIEMSKQRIWERKVEDDMERALQNDEFQVYLQPKFSTGEEVLGGAEALVRWIHPTEGFVPPNKFIPIFEKNGFILKLDDFMLEEVARQQAKWIAEGWKVVPISVNVSRAHFTREDLAEHICEIVDRYQVPHNVIELELTESAFFDDKQVLLSTVQKLRDAGFSVSMDDFGAGYSSLNSLKELSIDVLKIDADFFRGTDSLDRGMLIVSEVISLAKKLNMKIVAEGIESREQVDFLTEQECDLIQGYYFAKPMPLEEFEKNYKKEIRKCEMITKREKSFDNRKEQKT